MRKGGKNVAIVVSGGLAAAFALYYAFRRYGASSSSSDAKKRSEVHSAPEGVKDEYPDEIKEELTSRVKMFFGEEGAKKLENSFVIVVGLGGVGSHCANMLVRSGVAKIRLIDFDQVTLSSLNRHAVANINDVGISKAEAMRKHLGKDDRGFLHWYNRQLIQPVAFIPFI